MQRAQLERTMPVFGKATACLPHAFGGANRRDCVLESREGMQGGVHWPLPRASGGISGKLGTKQPCCMAIVTLACLMLRISENRQHRITFFTIAKYNLDARSLLTRQHPESLCR
jgi:hypothetical protein